MISFKRTDHFLITVPKDKLAEAAHFYQHVLELPILTGERPFNAVWFKIADVELHIMEENQGAISQRHAAFEVADLKAAESFLKLKGIEISYSTIIEGRDRLFFRDPYGNRFELLAFL